MTERTYNRLHIFLIYLVLAVSTFVAYEPVRHNYFVGFDDIELAQETLPQLTTVHVDKVLMGALGVRQLIDRADNPGRSALTISLSTQLIIRESVRSVHSVETK